MCIYRDQQQDDSVTLFSFSERNLLVHMVEVRVLGAVSCNIPIGKLTKFGLYNWTRVLMKIGWTDGWGPSWQRADSEGVMHPYGKSQLPTGPGKWSFSSTQHSWGDVWSTESSSGLLSMRKLWTYWSKSSKKSAKIIKRLEHLSCAERLSELGLSSLERTQEQFLINNNKINTWWEAMKGKKGVSAQW